MERVENREICSKCGGKCCKKSGCDYSTKDFDDLSLNAIYQKLEEGNISIVSFLEFNRLPNGRMTCIPFLYLRARNTGRDIVDLLSFKKQCSMLREDGCIYSVEDRPSGGINLVPNDNGPCRPAVNPFEIVIEWEAYQKQLRKLKRITGKSVEEKLREDAYQLFLDVAKGDFKDISPIEVEDVKGMIPLLARCYPDEIRRAVNVSDGIKIYSKR